MANWENVLRAINMASGKFSTSQDYQYHLHNIPANSICDAVEPAKVAQTGEKQATEGEENLDSPPLPAPLVRIPVEQQN